jgi:hypothetical protein
MDVRAARKNCRGVASRAGVSGRNAPPDRVPYLIYSAGRQLANDPVRPKRGAPCGPDPERREDTPPARRCAARTQSVVSGTSDSGQVPEPRQPPAGNRTGDRERRGGCAPRAPPSSTLPQRSAPGSLRPDPAAALPRQVVRRALPQARAAGPERTASDVRSPEARAAPPAVRGAPR